MKNYNRLCLSLSIASILPLSALCETKEAATSSVLAAERTPSGQLSSERSVIPNRGAQDVASDASEDLGAWSTAAWEGMKDVPFAQRTEVREQLKTAQGKLDVKIQEWEAKKNGLSEEAKEAAEPTLSEMRTAREWLARETESVGNATMETWTSVKHKVNVALQKVRSAHEKLDYRLRS